MVKMEPGLGKVLGNLFDQAYHTQLGVTVARNHPELGRSDLKEVMIRTAQDLAQRDANSYAARIASYGLKLDEDERDSLLEGKIPESFIYGRTQLIKKDAYKTILDFIKKAYDQELKSDLRSALTHHLEENLLQGEYDKQENSSYDSVMFYVHASPEQVYRSLFAQKDMKDAVPEAFEKLEMFDVENYLRHSFDDERQADLMSQAFKQAKAGQATNIQSFLTYIINDFEQSGTRNHNDRLEKATEALVRFQALVKVYKKDAKEQYEALQNPIED